MSRNKPLPGTGMLLTVATAIGLVRAVDDVAEEVRLPHERIDPETLSAPDSVDVKVVARIFLGVILVLWLVAVAIYPLFHYFMYDRTGGLEPQKVLAYQPTLPPRPRNVNQPFEVLEKYRKQQNGRLSNYYWVDRAKGIVAIPIDRAMDILAQQGVPATPPPKTPDEYYPPRAGSMRTGFDRKVVAEPQ